jgi:tetratricopeptide (TPR) repeat protein/DNA-binding CsgD family transcriptional regulator
MKALPLLLFIVTPFISRAQDDIEQAEKALLHQPKDTAYVNTLNKLARQAFNAHPEKTLIFAQQASKLSDSLRYTNGKIDALLNRSLLSNLKGNSPEELELQLSALTLSETANDSSSRAKIFAALGYTYYRMNDNKTAGKYFADALSRYTRDQNFLGMATVLRQIGNVELQERRYDTALEYYMKALDIEKKQQHTEGIANVLNNISIVYRSRNELEKATQYIEESIALNKKINNLNRLPAAYFNLNRIYLYQNRTEDALKLAQEELRIAQQLKLKPAIQEALIILTEVYSQKKDHATALKYFRWQVALSDSIKGQESSMKFVRLQAIYENEKKEKELDLLKAEQRLSESRNRLIYTATAAIFIIAIIIIIALRNRIRREKEMARKSDELHHAQQSLIESELANKQLAEKQLQQDLEFRHKELLTYTLNLVQKNNLMENLREGIQELLATTDKDSKIQLTKLIKVIDYSLESEKDWDEFRMYFEKVNSSFFQRLKNQFPDLTQSDLKLCALISLNLSMKEMAELMGISPESVKMARHRLRKKLNLVTEENLTEFLASFKLS